MKINQFIFSLALICCSLMLNAQVLEWAYNIGPAKSTTVDEVGENIVVDDSLNVYIIGNFEDTVDMDLSAGVHQVISSGYSNICLAKYDQYMNLIWCNHLYDESSATAVGLQISPDNTLQIVGGFSDTLDVDPSANEALLITVGYGDHFFAEYDLDGNYLQSWSFGNGGGDFIHNLHTDINGNIYMTGWFQNTVNFNPGGTPYNITSSCSVNGYLVCYDSSGSFRWAQSSSGGAVGNSNGNGVTTDMEGNTYWTGTFIDSAYLDYGSTTQVIYGGSNINGFVGKYDYEGELIWAIPLAGTGKCRAKCVDVDSNNDLLLFGYYQDSIDFDPSLNEHYCYSDSRNLFFAKYNSDGNLIWVKTIDSDNAIYSGEMTLDDLDNIYLTGHYGILADFNPDSIAVDTTWVADRSSFIVKYDNDGNYDWHLVADGKNFAYNLFVDNQYDTYFIGRLWLDSDFDPDTTGEHLLTTTNDADIFFAKYSQCITDSFELISSCEPIWWHGSLLTESGIYTYNETYPYSCDSVFHVDFEINVPEFSVNYSDGTVTVSGEGDSFQWLDCDNEYNQIPSETDISFSPYEDGNYAVEVTYSSCIDTSDCISVIGLNVDQEINNEYIVFPNPTDGIINIDCDDITRIDICDINGRHIISKDKAQIDLSHFQKGIYILKIYTTENVFVDKIIRK